MRGARGNRKRCEPGLFFGAENGIAQMAKNKPGCLLRLPFLWFVSFGEAKEMNILLSLFVQRKNERKTGPTSEAGRSAGNTNPGLFVRPLHLALKAPPKSPWFALFPVFPSRP
jgi:hypothetical protein